MNVKPERWFRIVRFHEICIFAECLKIDLIEEFILVNTDLCGCPDGNSYIRDHIHHDCDHISDVISSPDVGIGHKQDKRDKNKCYSGLEEGLVEVLHIIIDKRTCDRVSGRIFGTSDGIIEWLVEITHYAKRIGKCNDRRCEHYKADYLLQCHLFPVHVKIPVW